MIYPFMQQQCQHLYLKTKTQPILKIPLCWIDFSLLISTGKNPTTTSGSRREQLKIQKSTRQSSPSHPIPCSNTVVRHVFICRIVTLSTFRVHAFIFSYQIYGTSVLRVETVRHEMCTQQCCEVRFKRVNWKIYLSVGCYSNRAYVLLSFHLRWIRPLLQRETIFWFILWMS